MQSSNEILVSVNHVSRYYGSTRAVNDLSFNVHRGEVLGLLGPNGAGKTTTMQMITGNLAPSFGQISINQIDILDDPKQAKLDLGYLPEQPPLYKELTVDEFLLYCGKLNRIKKEKLHSALETAKEKTGLTDVGKRLIGNLSKGYQQRVGIAQAIIHSPDVVILDEPTVGLDPIQIREIRTLIRELGEEHSVILSTHILPEVTTTCDRVLIINKGELVLTETTEGLQKRMQSSSLILSFHQAPAMDLLLQFEGVDGMDDLGDGRFRMHHNPEIDPSEQIVNSSVEQGWRLYEITPEQLSLEEIFVDITCTELHDVQTETLQEASNA